MKNPMISFFTWLDANQANEQANILARLLLAYTPGTTYEDKEDNHDYIADLISAYKMETSPFKVYGLCVFTQTFLFNYFEDANNAFEMDDNHTESLNHPLQSLIKSWENILGFNKEVFDEYIWWIMEETFIGEPNSRIETLWNSQNRKF